MPGTLELVGNINQAKRYTAALVQTRYPQELIGVQLTASGMTTGKYAYRAAGANEATIVATSGITTEFWLAGIGLHTPSAGSIFVIKICQGVAGTPATRRAEFHKEFATDAGPFPSIMVPIPLYYPALLQVSGDAASNNVAADDTIRCAVLILA